MLTREQYNMIFDNGVRHLDASELLAKSEMYGFAVSHVVLGIEELIKYHVVSIYVSTEGDTQLFAQESNPENRDSVFRSHLAKHDLIKEFQLAISEEFAEVFANSLFKQMMGHELNDREKEAMNNRFRSTCAFLGVAYRELNLTDDQRAVFGQWLQTANSSKNNGFYVNWIGDDVIAPTKFTKEQYEQAILFGNTVKAHTQVIKDLDITDEEFIEIMNGPGS